MRVFRRNIIAAQLTGGHWVRAGIPGQCDLYAFVKGYETRVAKTLVEGCDPVEVTCYRHPTMPVEIECKNVRAVTTDKQKKWRAFCEEWGIPYLCLRARSDEVPDDTVARWLAETAELLTQYGA